MHRAPCQGLQEGSTQPLVRWKVPQFTSYSNSLKGRIWGTSLCMVELQLHKDSMVRVLYLDNKRCISKYPLVDLRGNKYPQEDLRGNKYPLVDPKASRFPLVDLKGNSI